MHDESIERELRALEQATAAGLTGDPSAEALSEGGTDSDTSDHPDAELRAGWLGLSRLLDANAPDLHEEALVDAVLSVEIERPRVWRRAGIHYALAASVLVAASVTLLMWQGNGELAVVALVPPAAEEGKTTDKASAEVESGSSVIDVAGNDGPPEAGSDNPPEAGSYNPPEAGDDVGVADVDASGGVVTGDRWYAEDDGWAADPLDLAIAMLYWDAARVQYRPPDLGSGAVLVQSQLDALAGELSDGSL